MTKLARKLEILARLESWNGKLETGPQAGSGWPAGTRSWKLHTSWKAATCEEKFFAG